MGAPTHKSLVGVPARVRRFLFGNRVQLIVAGHVAAAVCCVAVKAGKGAGAGVGQPTQLGF